MTNIRTKVALGIIATTVVALGTSCSLTLDALPLPTGSVPGETYTIDAVFSNALNLPFKAKVKVGGSDVGQVEDITPKNFTAVVKMRIRSDVELPKNSTAELRQATPLGDVFIAMSKPQDGQGKLVDGDTLPLDQTSAGATVEDLLVSISMLVNGGGLNQLQRIVNELDLAFRGRGPQIGHLIVQLTAGLGGLQARTVEIDRFLKEFDETISTINARKSELGGVIDSFPQVIGTLAENNKVIGDDLAKVALTTQSLAAFSDESGADMRELLDNTDRLMRGVADMGDHLGGLMQAAKDIRPLVDKTMRGTYLAGMLTVEFLSIGALTDPQGSKLPDGSDVTGFVGSFIDVLQRVYWRLNHETPPQPNTTQAPGGGR